MYASHSYNGQDHRVYSFNLCTIRISRAETNMEFSLNGKTNKYVFEQFEQINLPLKCLIYVRNA